MNDFRNQPLRPYRTFALFSLLIATAIITFQTQEEPSEPEIPYTMGDTADVYAEYNTAIGMYDRIETYKFLKQIQPEHIIGDVIMVDGLKWKLYMGRGSQEIFWTPHPEPEPVFEKEREEVRSHLVEYSNWINENPHMEYPPLPPIL
jgi:hypothetical protein